MDTSKWLAFEVVVSTPLSKKPNYYPPRPAWIRIICKVASGSRYFHIPESIWSIRNLANTALRRESSITAKVVFTKKATIGGISQNCWGPPK